MPPGKDIHAQLAAKKISAQALAKEVLSDAKILPQVLSGLGLSQARIKFGCAKTLILLSGMKPELLYPHLQAFVDLMEQENQILKWSGMIVLGSLAPADQERRLPRLLPKFYHLLSAEQLITANNAIAALGKIALAYPKKRAAITAELLKVENYSFQTEECRKIALGKVILALNLYLGDTPVQDEVIEFVRRQTTNSRAATAKKAKMLLTKLRALSTGVR